MLNDAQLQHFKTFGFLILKNALSADEVRTMQGEWARRAQEADQSIPFEGTRTRDMMALDATTPFITALFEDDRLAGMGEQIFGRLHSRERHRPSLRGR